MRKDFELHGSLQSLQELEMVQPPSGMNSIISLSSSLDTEAKKKTFIRADSLLENVKPPTEMEDVPDLDNSIMSVASLTSEIAESLEDLTLEATPPSQRKANAKQKRLGKFRQVLRLLFHVFRFTFPSDSIYSLRINFNLLIKHGFIGSANMLANMF